MLSPILACSDVNQAIAYYTERLGFELMWSMPPNERGETDFACVRLGDAEILLGITAGFVASEDLSRRGIGVQLYISLPETLNVDAVFATAKAQGARMSREIETRDWGERAFTVRDLDGYQLMIAQTVK